MRRLVYISLAVAILPWIVIGIVREATDDDTKEAYYVRAIFDNASTIVPGEDVKIAGVPVGVVADMNVTEENQAAVTLRIDDEAFTPFKADAHCTIRPQSLIGEKFVECEPGTADAEAIAVIEEGDGEGEHLLPVENNSSPVDLDLINNIMRLPYRERFAILLSELGVGLAGRGEDLNEVIHRANPALRETDEVLALLAEQNRTLARLAREGDRALGPIARERDRVANFIVEAGRTAEATAERRDDIRRGIELLPDFLVQLRLLMGDLEGFADQGTPLLADLGEAAPALGRLIKGQGTLATASRESFPSLGEALERGRPALLRAQPLIQDLNKLGTQLEPVSNNLNQLTKSLDKTGFVPRINDFLYYLALSTNGFDQLGHYLRAGLVTNTCSSYALEPATGCNANFFNPLEEAGASGSELEARNASEPESTAGGSVAPAGTLLGGLLGQGQDRSATFQRRQTMKQLRQRSSGQSPALGEEEPMLEYLFGEEAP